MFVNKDGSISKTPVTKTINNIEWLDYRQYRDKISLWQVVFHIVCLFPIFGWGLAIVSWCTVRFTCGYWPFFGIRAIEQTNEPIKIYCDKKGKLGLYANKRRVTSAKYISVQQLPTNDYPTFVLESKDKFSTYSLYNHIQGKILFKNSELISYLGNNNVLVRKGGVDNKFSLIGMLIE